LAGANIEPFFAYKK